MCLCVCVWERERECVCVSVCERVCVCVRAWACLCVNLAKSCGSCWGLPIWTHKMLHIVTCVCVSVCVCLCVCVCVWVCVCVSLGKEEHLTRFLPMSLPSLFLSLDWTLSSLSELGTCGFFLWEATLNRAGHLRYFRLERHFSVTKTQVPSSVNSFLFGARTPETTCFFVKRDW